jgi:molybdate transport system permease protein
MFGLDIIFTWRAVVIALTVMSLPLLVRSARSAFEGLTGLTSKLPELLAPASGGFFAR